MRLFSYLHATYVNSSEGEYENKNTGLKTKNYYISLDQEAQCGTLRCTEEVFQALKGFNRFEDVILHAEFNDQYNTFKVVGVQKRQK